MRNPKYMGVMCFLRWIDDEPTEEGMNVIKDLRQWAGINLLLWRAAVFRFALPPLIILAH
jgi:hypothetical protein